mgnify:CR=1 FL=1
MQDVAEAVGITAAALYRHFGNKYELFRDTAMHLVGRLQEAVDSVPAAHTDGTDAAEGEIVALIDVLVDTTIELRATGSIYRWESRYLTPEDRRDLRDAFSRVRSRVAAPLREVRPDLDDATGDLAVLAALSSIASVTTHRTTMPVPQLRVLLREVALRVLRSHVGPIPPDAADSVPEHAQPRRRKDQLTQAGIALFAARGYHDVTIDDIASAVGLTPSGVYRHFSGKSDILRTACERAATALDAAADEALGRSNPHEALSILGQAYVHFAVTDHDLMEVYTADVGALDDDDQRRLLRLQRGHVDDWVEVVGRVRTGLQPRELRFLVHAGFNVVADLSVALRHSTPAEAQAFIRPVLNTVLEG